MSSYQITLKKEILNVDDPNYYVAVEEGAFFDLCKAQKENLSAVSTSGLSGCIAMAIYIKDGDKSYIFLNHIISDLPISKVDSVIEKVKKTIRKYLPDFDYDDDIFDISIFVIGNQFIDLTSEISTQFRSKKQDIGHEIVKNISNRISNIDRKCYVAHATSVAFTIKGNKVKLIEPDWKNTKGSLTYFGEKHGGYGYPIDPNDEPYKNTCIETDLEY